ncbi:MAG TPA: DinB family protein [Acidimicrobiales bacterium]|nr:DinB family protein [Acidimicrobiales bacterium]
MTGPYDDAFDHHAWANDRLIDACAALDDALLDAPQPGGYGSARATLVHLVDGDAFYLWCLTGRDQPAGLESMSLTQLGEVARGNAAAWRDYLASGPDPGEVVTDNDGPDYHRDASVGLRLAQALHHGNEHRAQVCVGVSAGGAAEVDVSVWLFGDETGRVREVGPDSQ